METVRELERRLNVGWERINETPPGPRRTALEDFWLKLLREYEERCMTMFYPATFRSNGTQTR